MTEREIYDRKELEKSKGCFGTLLFIFVLAVVALIFIFGCSSSHVVTTPPPTWSINDTFFYRRDASFRQYPKDIAGASLNWFYSNPFLIIAIDDTNSRIEFDTIIDCSEDDNTLCDTLIESHYTAFIILQSYSVADKSKFHYLKLVQ